MDRFATARAVLYHKCLMEARRDRSQGFVRGLRSLRVPGVTNAFGAIVAILSIPIAMKSQTRVAWKL